MRRWRWRWCHWNPGIDWFLRPGFHWFLRPGFQRFLRPGFHRFLRPGFHGFRHFEQPRDGLEGRGQFALEPEFVVEVRHHGSPHVVVADLHLGGPVLLLLAPVIVRAGAALCHQAGHHTASKDQRYLITSTIIRYISGCFGLQPYTLGIAAPCTVTRVTISQDIQQARVGVGGRTRYT